MRVLNPLVRLFFPGLCLACGDDAVGRTELLCFECLSELPFTNFHLQRDNKTERIFYGRVKIEHAMSLLYFSKNMIVRNVMHELKYRGQKELGVFLGKMMGKAIVESSDFEDVDQIIPLPLSGRKLRARGYNQSEILCKGMSLVMDKPVLADAVLRSVDTETQTRKHRRERWENVEGIFEVAKPRLLEGKHLLLVDDVLTTGATLESCAATLLKVPGSRVSIATLAIAMK